MLYFVVDIVGMVSQFAHGVVFVCCAYAVVHLLQRHLVNVVVYGGIEHFGAYVEHLTHLIVLRYLPELKLFSLTEPLVLLSSSEQDMRR